MALTAGSRLGPYEIVGVLGAGGMGEVYRARDARLDRQVAIKVLPASVSADADRRARFEREVKAIAALSHPNILAIHDIGESTAPGTERPLLFAVTELLDGDTLRDRLTTQGALPVRKALDIAIQIARGLSAAHDRGIIHRDLKPENIFLLSDGQVKILDFGLARQAVPGTGSGATETVAAITDPGTVMGTVGYMSPEQVRGQAIDARADLFALGATLYEMLSGRRAFHRDTAAETMTAVLREDPPELASTRSDLSPGLERIVRHCLEKNPAERFQTARDVAFALEAFSGTDIGSRPLPAMPGTRRSWRAAAIAVALTVAAAAAGYAARAWLEPAAAPPIAFEQRTWDAQWISNARFAPDGQSIVFSAAASGNLPSVFVMRPGTNVPQPLGPPRTHLLSVSKTGELAVLTGVTYINHRVFQGTLTRMSMDGGTRGLLEQVREADWSPDGSALAVIHDVGGRDRVEYPVGTPLYEGQAGRYLSDPRVSPDGTRVAFFEHSTRWDDRGWLKVVDRSKAVTTLGGEFLGAEGLTWSPRGRSLFFSTLSPDIIGYQPHVVNTDGSPRVRPAFPSIINAITMDAAADGRLLYTAGESVLSIRAMVPGESTERELPWLDIALASDLSDDGRWLLFGDESLSAGPNYAVSLRNTDGTPAVKLGEGAALSLSRDGQWALAVVLSPPPGHWVVYPTGAGQPKPIDFAPLTQIGRAGFLRDGRVYVCGAAPNTQRRCFRKDVNGGPLEPMTPEGIVDGSPSPDGRSMLVQNATRQWQLLDLTSGAVRDVPGDHRDDIVGGWSRDGRSVFVRASSRVPAQIDRIDLITGVRTHLRELMPADRTGVMAIYPGPIVSDGQGYAYTYWRQSQKAVVVKGVPVD